jgi:hypothetical protein
MPFSRRRLLEVSLSPVLGLLAPGYAMALAEEPKRFEFRDPRRTGTPVGWTRVNNVGKAKSEVRAIDGETALSIDTKKGHLRFEQDVQIGSPERLQISWDWRVHEMPEAPRYKPWNDGGRKTLYVTNSPIQVIVAFRAGISTFHAIHFVWDPVVEMGYSWVEKETQYGFVKLTYPRLVVRSGKEDMDRWHHEVRDLRADYLKFFPGKTVPPVVRVAIQSQSEHADGDGASGRASIANLQFITD